MDKLIYHASASRSALAGQIRYIARMSTSPAIPADWIQPQWPAPQGVRALFTTRAGGVSAAPFDSFNLGDHVQDDPEAVTRNRAVLASVAGVHPVFLQQVHGCDVLPLESTSADGQVADACFSTTRGVACTVMVADCLPVLFSHRSLPLVGAAHAGWRGLAGAEGVGVLERLLQAMDAALQRQHAGTPADWIAWLGPCIGQSAFEVGDEVREAFSMHHAGAAQYFGQGVRPGKWQADLAGLARHRLQAMGVEVHGNDSSAAWCTFSQPQRFYSYRRASRTGRMAAAVWLSV